MIKEKRENLFSDARARVRVAQVSSEDARPSPRKRSSARARGLAYQRKIRKFLEERGYQVQNIPPKSFRFFNRKTGKSGFASLQNDIFGCDLIAKKNDRVTLWIQTTLHKSLKEKMKVLAQFPWTDREEVLVFIHRESGADDIIEFNPFHPDQTLHIATIKRKKFFGLNNRGFYFFGEEGKNGRSDSR